MQWFQSECNGASEKERVEIQQMFLTDLLLKQQSAGTEPALTWENQQHVCGTFKTSKAASLPWRISYSCRSLSCILSVLIVLCVILTCTFGLLLPYPARFYVLFGKHEELPTLPLAVLEWQWNLHMDNWKTDGEAGSGWEGIAPSSRYNKKLTKYFQYEAGMLQMAQRHLWDVQPFRSTGWGMHFSFWG